MGKACVIYASKNGSTKEYAQYIAQRANCDCISIKELSGDTMQKYDVLVFGGGIYAGNLHGTKYIMRHIDVFKSKRIAVFFVGISDPENEGAYKEVIDKTFTDDMLEHITVFKLRGRLDIKRVSVIDRAMLSMVIRVLEKKPEDKKTDDDRIMIGAKESTVDFVALESAQPVIDFICAATQGSQA